MAPTSIPWSASDEILWSSEQIAFRCPENPARLRGLPIGMYHCPFCGCMTIAGIDAHPHELGCLVGLWDLDPRYWDND